MFFTVDAVILTVICVSSIQQYIWNNYTNNFCHGYMFLCYFVWFVFHHLIAFLYISMCSCVCLVCCIFHISYNLISCGRFPLHDRSPVHFVNVFNCFVLFWFCNSIVLVISICTSVIFLCNNTVDVQLCSTNKHIYISGDFGPWWPSDLGLDIIVVSLMHRGFTVGFSSFASSLWWE